MTSAATAPMTSTHSNALLQKIPTLREIKAERARRGLIQFTSYTNPVYVAASHHEQIAAKLEAVLRGEIDRLMIFMPPRHGKSELASRRFPARYLGEYPDRHVIAASYNSDLAKDFGREVKHLMQSPEYGDVYPGVRLREDSRAADRMNTEVGGAYFAVGVGTATTGRGAHLAIIDDPLKDREEADSEVQRNKVWDWYRSTLFTRLMPGGAVVLIQTRWHEDDLAGRLLEAQPDQWEVLELSAINQDGKALWPEWYPLETLERIKDTIGPREWSALYQQKPQPDEGTFFQRGWFKQWDDLPKLRYYGTSDYAVTEGDGDFTVHRVWGIDADSNIYRIAGWREKASADRWIESQLDLVKKYKPLAWFAEGGPIRRAVEPFLLKRMRERKDFCRLEWLTRIADKPTKARAFQARAAMGKVYLEPGADLGEFLVFPAGKHDDDVDAAGLIGMAVDQAHPAILSPTGERKVIDAWDQDDEEADGWKTV